MQEGKQHVYVLCSKYSEACAAFLNTVAKYEIDIVIPVFIDSQYARDIVKKSKLNIQTVPCIIGNINGYFATYEGSDAFTWLEDISKMYIKPPPTDEDLPSPESVPEKLNGHVNHKLVDTRSVAEKMRQEREQTDEVLHDTKRIPKSSRTQLESVNELDVDIPPRHASFEDAISSRE